MSSAKVNVSENTLQLEFPITVSLETDEERPTTSRNGADAAGTLPPRRFVGPAGSRTVARWRDSW